jgi:protein transport protein SEC13
MDYYGKRLATASSDRTIKIFEVNGDKQTQIAHLRGYYITVVQQLLHACDGGNNSLMHVTHCHSHDGPVWAVAWSHPKWGPLLASCGYDGRVLLWKEAAGVWNKIFEDASHEASGGGMFTSSSRR